MYNKLVSKHRDMLYFYRRSYRSLVTVMLILIFIAIMEFLVINYFILVMPSAPFYAVHDDGSLAAIKPLAQPNVASKALAQWEN